MTAPLTAISPRSAVFRQNRDAMLASVSQVKDLLRQALAGGGPTSIDRHLGRGKLLVRDRVKHLIDPGSPLLELSTLAGVETEDSLGGSLMTCVGTVCGVQTVIVGNDATVRGGSLNPTSVKKIMRALEIARVNRLPLITLVESAGADLPRQAETFVTGGAMFKEISRLSRSGIPTIATVFGSSTAGGAYMPGMSDYTVFVEGQAKVFLGGPPLVKMATGEDADEEELGGALMHATTSGLADFLARDEQHAISITRRIMKRLAHNLPRQQLLVGPAPQFDAEELLGVPSADPRTPFDMREVVLRIVDDSQFDEFKPLYGQNLVCGWAEMFGRPLGIVANNGVLFSAEAQKATHFIQLCNQSRTPLLFVHNITGFMVGTRYEQGGIIKDGSKMVNAVSNSSVPHLVLMVGSSFGAGNYAMAGRAYDARFVFTWPSHRIGVMGGKQLAGVLSTIRREAAERDGRTLDADVELENAQRIETQIDHESSALYATGHVWDDGIIDPRDTRTVLGLALSAACSSHEFEDPRYAVFRM